MGNHLRLGPVLDGTEPAVVLGLDSVTLEVFSKLNSSMELSGLQEEQRDGKRDKVTGMKR